MSFTPSTRPLCSIISSASAPLTIELNTFRAALQKDKKDGRHARAARSTSTRADLQNRQDVLRQAIVTPASLHAAWLALLDAYRDRTDERTLDQRYAELWRLAPLGRWKVHGRVIFLGCDSGLLDSVVDGAFERSPRFRERCALGDVGGQGWVELGQ